MMRLGNVLLNPEEYRAEVDGRSADLTSMEFRLLAILFEAPNRVWSPQQLAAQLGEQCAGPGGIATLVWRLRRKLEGAERCRIVTVRKRGYALACDTGDLKP